MLVFAPPFPPPRGRSITEGRIIRTYVHTMLTAMVASCAFFFRVGRAGRERGDKVETCVLHTYDKVFSPSLFFFYVQQWYVHKSCRYVSSLL